MCPEVTVFEPAISVVASRAGVIGPVAVGFAVVELGHAAEVVALPVDEPQAASSATLIRPHRARTHGNLPLTAPVVRICGSPVS